MNRKPEVNPFSPPETVDDQFKMTRRSIRVGVEELSKVIIEMSIWRGIKTYSTDSSGRSTPVQRGPCQFEVGQHERHEVKVQVDGGGRAGLWIDGELVEGDLFPEIRKRIYVCVGVFVLGLAFVMSWASVFILRWLK